MSGFKYSQWKRNGWSGLAAYHYRAQWVNQSNLCQHLRITHMPERTGIVLYTSLWHKLGIKGEKNHNECQTNSPKNLCREIKANGKRESKGKGR